MGLIKILSKQWIYTKENATQHCVGCHASQRHQSSSKIGQASPQYLLMVSRNLGYSNQKTLWQQARWTGTLKYETPQILLYCFQ
jgi:hypothetical protein